jgi:hypothetical protein
LGDTEINQLCFGAHFLSDVNEEMPQEIVLGTSAFIGDTDECNSFVRFIAQWFAVVDNPMENTGGFLSFGRVKRLICGKFDYSLERYLMTMAR